MIKIVTTFGLNDVAVATATTDGSQPAWVDIPMVSAATFKQTVQEVDQNGDDAYQGTYRFGQKGLITIKGSQASMQVFETISGSTASSLSGGAGHILIGTNAELTPPFLCVRTTISCTKSDGTAAQVKAYFYKCAVSTPFSGYPDGAYGKLGEIQFDMHVYKTTKSYIGATLPNSESALGHLEIP